MHADVLLGLLNKIVEKRSNMRLCRAFYHFFPTHFINSIVQKQVVRFYLLLKIKLL